MVKNLKYFRIAFALIVFVIFILTFSGITAIIPNVKIIKGVTWLQFIPSILRFTVYFSLLFAGGFVVVALLTLLFGRIYCSALCPLGIFQDFISRIGKILGKRKIYRFSKPRNLVRYTILVVTILSLFTGSILLLNILDPYSIFGKIFSHIFRPLAILLNDLASKTLEKFDLYSLAPAGIKMISIYGLVYSIILLVIISIFSFSRGRLFCNTICPVGTSLGLLSKVSILKIKIDRFACTKCGKCSTQCKSECIDIKSVQVDFSRCVACYNCLKICPEKSINYGFTYNATKTAESEFSQSEYSLSNSRRLFVQKSLLFTGAVGLLSFKTIKDAENLKSGKHLHKKTNSVTPPGSYSLAHFASKCTACQLCMSACPTQVLQPSSKEFGITSTLVPFLDFDKSFCNYDCTLCSEVCPNGALIKISTNEKKATQIGKVVFYKENCVVYADETSCGACSEHCPTKAVQMVPYKNSLTIPETDVNICVGCGACEYACPTKPYKAIFVEGNPVHRTAFKPKSEKQKDLVPQDFPF